MITHCFHVEGLLDLTETGFFADTFQLVSVIAPAALCFLLWRLFVTNRTGRRGDVTVLGLDDSSRVYSDLGPSKISRYARVAYLLVGVSTFTIGLLTSMLVSYLS